MDPMGDRKYIWLRGVTRIYIQDVILGYILYASACIFQQWRLSVYLPFGRKFKPVDIVICFKIWNYRPHVSIAPIYNTILLY